MRAIKKDPAFKKVMETQKELKDWEGFDWLESTELKGAMSAGEHAL